MPKTSPQKTITIGDKKDAMENVIDIETCRCACHKSSDAEKLIHNPGELCCFSCKWCFKTRISASRYPAHREQCKGLQKLIDDLDQGKCMDDYTGKA